MKSFKIAGIEIKSKYVGAPLAGYSSLPMRKLDFSYGSYLNYTEMTSCNALNYHNSKTDAMLPLEKEDGLLALQLFGSDLETVIKAIKYIESKAMYDFLDFNLGCPAKKVLKQGSGSYLLQDKDYLYKLMRNIVITSSKPVICKMRLGFNSIEGVEIASILEQAGVQAICVHGRTTKELFMGEVHYDEIRKIKDKVSIPVIANGNIGINNIEQVEQITNADAFMIGREAIGYPKIFEDLINKEEGREIRKKNFLEQEECFKKHIELACKEKDELGACILLRGVAAAYFKGLENMKELRMKLVTCSSKEEYYSALNEYKKKNFI